MPKITQIPFFFGIFGPSFSACLGHFFGHFWAEGLFLFFGHFLPIFGFLPVYLPFYSRPPDSQESSSLDAPLRSFERASCNITSSSDFMLTGVKLFTKEVNVILRVQQPRVRKWWFPNGGSSLVLERGKGVAERGGRVLRTSQHFSALFLDHVA